MKQTVIFSCEIILYGWSKRKNGSEIRGRYIKEDLELYTQVFEALIQISVQW